MSSTDSKAEVADITAENIGGIDETRVELSPGVTVLAGRNATNRTSLLQAFMAALGSENVSLKGNADEGRVELALGDETHTRTLRRGPDGTVHASGDPYLDDPELADLFAFLLESNEARRAVARSDDLRELIMRPVDTGAIQEQIRSLEAEKRRVESDIEELEQLEDDLPELERERSRLDAEIEEKRAALEAKEEEIEEADLDVERGREERAALEDRLDDLQSTRSRLERVRFDIETERESIAALRDDLDELEATTDDLQDAPSGDVEDVEDRIDRLRDRKQRLDSDVSELQSIIRFNEEMLAGENNTILESLDDSDESENGALTDQLLSDGDTVTCWTCGTDVEKEQIRATVDNLSEFRERKLDERKDVQSELNDLKETRRELRQERERREDVRRKRSRLENEIERREETIDELEDEQASLREEIDELEGEVEQLEDEDFSEILSLHREANELEFELEQLEDDLEETKSEIARVESQLAERESLADQRDELADELADLRTRIDQIETQAIEGFNEHMETVLDILGYANIERIWIERTEKQVTEGRRKVSRNAFELHIVRSTSSGTAYEDTVDHLSESEREVTGLVFALAGYLVHDVHETVPFMLLDSLEAIDSERIGKLVEYMSDYADYLVVALLPGDAAAIDDSHERITEI